MSGFDIGTREILQRRGKLSELESERGFRGQLSYFPQNVESLNYWVAFRIAKDNKFRRDRVSKRQTEATIVLPMPENIQTGYNAQYANPGIGPFGAAGAALGENIAIGQDVGASLSSALTNQTLEDLKSNLKSGLTNIFAGVASSELSALAGGLIGGAPGLAIGAGVGGAVQGALAGAGVALNPGLATLFEGTNFRTHSFNYKFIPRNEKEQEDLRFIVKQFKRAMSPELISEDHFFRYPNQFDIDFHFPKFYFDIGASVLTGFDVNYSTEGRNFVHPFRKLPDSKLRSQEKWKT